MKSRLKILAVLAVSICAIISWQVKADAILFVSPTRINLNEKNKIEVVNISNVSSVSRAYKISIQDLVMTENGTTKPVDDFSFSAKKMIKFFPREFTVQPGQGQVIRIMAKIPADLPDGEYHSHIKFFEDATQQGQIPVPANGIHIVAPLAYSTMLPVTISKGKIDTQINWVEPKIINGPKPNTYVFSTDLTRSGNGQGRAYMDLMYIPVSGDPIQIGNRRTSYIYRELDRLHFEYQFSLPSGATPKGKIKINLLSGDITNPVPVTDALLAIP